MWVTGLSDADGYRLYFESPTDTPEDTKLSESVKWNERPGWRPSRKCVQL